MNAKELDQLVRDSGLPVPEGWGFLAKQEHTFPNTDDWVKYGSRRDAKEAEDAILAHAIEEANRRGLSVTFCPKSAGVLCNICDYPAMTVRKEETRPTHIAALAACWARAFPKDQP